MELKRLGDYIREINLRNRDLKVTKPMGINIDKYFMPSVANVIGTDLSVYKLVAKKQFACNLMHVGRDERIPMAMLTDNNPIIVSPAYFVFEVVKQNDLLPEYLMMWFRRQEFDRNAWFYTDADVRGGLDKDALCNMRLPIPSIDRQREIVSEYETLTNRIRINEQMISKLEDTAQTLYRKMFVDSIDKENLPEGWRMGMFTDVVRISGGGTPDTSDICFWNGDIPFFTPADSTNDYYCIKTEKSLTIEGLNNCSSKLYEKNSTFVTARGTVGEVSLAGKKMAMNQSCYALLSKESYVPFYIHQLSIETISSLKEEAVGAVFRALVTKDFELKEVIIPPVTLMEEYNSVVSNIYNNILIRQNENTKLTELQSLLLAKMGR